MSLSGAERSGFAGVMSVAFVHNPSDLYIKIRVAANDLKLGNGELTVMLVCRHQQYIGRVKHAVFQTQGTGRKRVVVATEQNAIASLNLRTGDICTFYCCPIPFRVLQMVLYVMNIIE